MRFFPVAAALFALMDFSSAWTKDGNGVWTANNEHYWIRGGESIIAGQLQQNSHVSRLCTRGMHGDEH
jgi:hypothetical protein